MALTVSMTTDPTTHAALATITGDAGDDDLIVEISETLSAIADTQHLIVDIADTQHLRARHLDQLLDHTPERVIIIHPTKRARSRLASSLTEARQLIETKPDHPSQRGDPECTS